MLLRFSALVLRVDHVFLTLIRHEDSRGISQLKKLRLSFAKKQHERGSAQLSHDHRFNESGVLSFWLG